jgi:hypothetical protein
VIPYLIYTPIVGVMTVMGFAFNPIVEKTLGNTWNRIIIWFLYQAACFTGLMFLAIKSVQI